MRGRERRRGVVMRKRMHAKRKKKKVKERAEQRQLGERESELRPLNSGQGAGLCCY